jgi:UDP-2,3-diacylglucosamine hydrolase
MQRIFLSDLHLSDPEDKVFIGLAACLEAEAKQVDEIYILGDLVEMWIGDDDNSPIAAALTELLSNASKHCKIFLMHGNRDFLFGEKFATQAGVKLINDPTTLDEEILLTHGDALCTDDGEYQEMRKILRSEAWQQDILRKSLAERIKFGQDLRAESIANNANKSSAIMDVNASAVTNFVTPNIKRLIHGHTHRPGEHKIGQRQSKRIVLGDWGPCGWLCRQVGDKFTLECFNLAHRYGI